MPLGNFWVHKRVTGLSRIHGALPLLKISASKTPRGPHLGSILDPLVDQIVARRSRQGLGLSRSKNTKLPSMFGPARRTCHEENDGHRAG